MMSKVYYKRLIEGQTVPAVIHNGNYFYISMPVFEDGTIDCWKRIELDALENNLEKGWLVTSIPIGAEICLHGLGDFIIKSAEWKHTPQTYVDHIRQCVQQMNSDMTGLFTETPEQKEKGHQKDWCTKATPYKLTKGFLNWLTDGTATSLFYRSENSWILTTITAYADGALDLEATGQTLTMEDVETLFSSGVLSSDIEGEFLLSFPGFADLRVTATDSIDSKDKLAEIRDLLAEATGQKTSLDLCQSLYYEYLVYPSEHNRERLREAYENVPEHERMFLGDMDTKDRDYIRILYHPERKREV